MLQPILSELSTLRIVLASGSPRRKDALNNTGLKFEVVPSTFEENLDKYLFSSPTDYVEETALGKATEVAERLRGENRPDLVIGADTVITLGDKIFEKPKDKEDAFEMLSQLSGSTHHVHTGVVLITPKGREESANEPFNVTRFHETTEIRLSEMSPEVIRAYIATGEPLDKAGGYGYQKLGGSLVSGIKGDYYNVIGFPIHSFCRQLVRLF